MVSLIGGRAPVKLRGRVLPRRALNSDYGCGCEKLRGAFVRVRGGAAKCAGLPEAGNPPLQGVADDVVVFETSFLLRRSEWRGGGFAAALRERRV